MAGEGANLCLKIRVERRDLLNWSGSLALLTVCQIIRNFGLSSQLSIQPRSPRTTTCSLRLAKGLGQCLQEWDVTEIVLAGSAI
jgi:hypothetical protein